MNMTKNLFFLLLAVPLLYASIWATELDEINKSILNSKKDTVRVDLLLKAGDFYEYTQPDSAILFYQQAYELSVEINSKSRIAKCSNYIGIVYWNMGMYHDAISNFENALVIVTELNQKQKIAACLNNLGNVYKDIGHYEKAIQHYINSLRIKEEIKDSSGISASYNNLGVVHEKLKSYDKALDYYNRALIIRNKLNDEKGVADVYVNIGLINKETGDFFKALDFFNRALEKYLKIEDMKGISACYGNIGNVYLNGTGDLQKASDYINKSLEVDRKIGNQLGIAQMLNSLAVLNYQTKNFNSSISFAKQSAEISSEYDYLPVLKTSYEYLFLSYEALGHYKEALQYLKRNRTITDSIYNEESVKQMKELEAKYESDKKELLIDNLNKENIIKEIEINKSQEVRKKQFYLIILFIALLALVFTTLIFIYKQYVTKKKSNLLLKKFNSEIIQKNEEISTQRDEIAAQRDLATNQRDIIAKQQKDIKDSINYAFQIQSALFPTDEDLRLILKDYFIFYRPRDIVSGDFYWVNKFGNKIIIVASDCTGHGVPGAFMSMLGIAFLNEIVNKEQVTAPDKILNRLRENIILAMKQHGENVKQQDGMDAVAITIDRQAGTLEFAGANNPLYIVSGSGLRVPGSGNPKPETRNPKPGTDRAQRRQNARSHIFADAALYPALLPRFRRRPHLHFQRWLCRSVRGTRGKEIQVQTIKRTAHGQQPAAHGRSERHTGKDLRRLAGKYAAD
jgi:tetratricopeptide (TPR) repeat protein